MGIRDVARAAGVSVTTVSHALSGARTVKPATRERVLREVERLGYRPDPLARGLRSQRTSIVGLLGDRVITSPHVSLMVLGAQLAAAERGSFVVALDSGGDLAVEERQIRGLRDHHVDGMVYARMHHQEVRLPAGLTEWPVVLLDARTPDRSLPSIVPDERGIAVTAVGHLLSRGHVRIGFATTTDDAPAVVGREDGFREALRQAGLEVDETLIARSTANADGGRRSGTLLLDQPDPPTAVFCFNDQVAMGVYQAAARLGLSVPADVSVVGVDNLPLVADALDPGLTTVEVPHFQMGRWAVNALLDQIEGRADAGPGQVQLRCELVQRGSVAPPR